MEEPPSIKDLSLMAFTRPLQKQCKTSVLGDYVLSNSKVVKYVLKKCRAKGVGSI